MESRLGFCDRKNDLVFFVEFQEAHSLTSEREKYKADYRKVVCLFLH